MMAEIEEPQPATAAPKAGQKIQHEGNTYTTVQEGLAYILTPMGEPQLTDPKKKRKEEENGPVQSVFYNPIQQFNRDLSVLAIRAFGEDVVQARSLKAAAKDSRAKKQHEKKYAQLLMKHDEIADARTKQLIEEELKHPDFIPGTPDEILNASGISRKSHDAGLYQKAALSLADTHEVVANDTEANGTSIPASAEDSDDMSISRGVKRKREDISTQETLDELPTKKKCSNGEIKDNEAAGVEATSMSVKLDDMEDQGINDSDLLALDNSKLRSSTLNLPPFSILDALSATGLRALRYAHEIPFATSITANDLSPKATAMIKLNAEHNSLSSKISAVTGNALAHMYSLTGQEGKGGPGHKYDVIDLDPYGTAAPFLDAAVQAVNDGGLLCVTCTDAAVFASSGYPEKTFSQYGGLPLKGVQSHEAGLRLILHSIATSAARYGIAIEPLLSLSIDYYIRVFVRIRRSPAEVKFFAGKTMVVYNCDSGCGAWTTQLLGRNTPQEDKRGGTYYKHQVSQGPTASQLCEHCGFKTHIAGPMYGGPLHNSAFVQRILDYLPSLNTSTYATADRIKGMLSNVLEECSLTENALIPDPIFAKLHQPPPSANSLDSRSSTDTSNNSHVFLPRLAPTAIDAHPFFFKPDYLARVLHCMSPSEAALKGALRHLGYRAVRTHVKPGMVKTDAPWTAVWRVMREWIRQKAPIKEGALKEAMAGWGIMKRGEGDKEGGEASERKNGKTDDQQEGEVVFDEKLGRKDDVKGLVRYQLNPRANWGPMTRAKGV